jgi:hypothetical protein
LDPIKTLKIFLSTPANIKKSPPAKTRGDGKVQNEINYFNFAAI